MNQPQQQYHYKSIDPDLDEYLSEYKNQTPLESDQYAGEYSEKYLVKLLINKKCPTCTVFNFVNVSFKINLNDTTKVNFQD